jgi:hypothetical protein
MKNIIPFGTDDESSDDLFDRLSGEVTKLRTASIVPIFIRMPSHVGEDSPFLRRYINYYAARKLIAGNGDPRVRAHDLTLPGKPRGVVLIDYISLLNYEINLWNAHAAEKLPLVATPPPPEFLTIPRNAQSCPYTGLKPTKFRELVSSKSPYGPTGIQTTMLPLVPGSKLVKFVETTSLVRFIRSLPAPDYSLPKGR